MDGNQFGKKVKFEEGNVKVEPHAFGLDASTSKLPCESETKLFPEHQVLQMEFDSEDDAHAFYNAYASAHGFSVRKDKVRSGHGIVLSRRWVCSRQGYRANVHPERNERKTYPRSLTRTGCAVQFSVLYDKKVGKCKVRRFVTEHNHQCATTTSIPFLRSHRSISSPIKAQVESMRAVGVKASQIMDYIVQQYGSHANVGFIKKDLANHIHGERKLEMADGDAEAALVYLCVKRDSEPLFFYKYAVGENNKLVRLLWCDALSRMDYASFGDVLVFDTTYRTNAYRKPFVIMAGVNNHFLTTIYACALLVDETVATYTWVLRTLLEAMDNKAPVSVLTDGDRAMREAIRVVFPDARHRLCSWHLHRNAMTNVSVPGFGEQFKHLMGLDVDILAFEEGWTKMVRQHGLETNKWVLETYENRGMWSEAYLRGAFFAGMKSTQRCEGMHSFFKSFLPLKLKLFEFVRHYERALGTLRNNICRAHATTENTEPVLTTPLRRLEKHASLAYTRNIFYKFREEINKSCTFFITNKKEGTDQRAYTLEKWTVCGSYWEVVYFPADGRMSCCCKMLESIGIPCCHMIAVMKCEHLTEIPPRCVVVRWTPSASDQGLKHMRNQNESCNLSSTTRFGVLSAFFKDMCYYASLTIEGFDEACNVAFETTKRMKRLSKHDTWEGDVGNIASQERHRVNDPDKVTTKGNPGRGYVNGKQQKPRRCGGCGLIGHTKRTCAKITNASRGIGSNTCDGRFSSGAVSFHPDPIPHPINTPTPTTPKCPSHKEMPPKPYVNVRRTLFTATDGLFRSSVEHSVKRVVNFDSGSQNGQSVQNASFTVDDADRERYPLIMWCNYNGSTQTTTYRARREVWFTKAVVDSDVNC